jgi:protein SCO1/2
MKKSKSVLISLILVTVLAWATGCQMLQSDREFRGTVYEPPVAVPDFTLTDSGNQPFSLSDVKGNATLIFFGYTYCPDVCPLTMADVKTALNDFEYRDDVEVIFISVDPERDTPEVLNDYLDHFDPDFIGLTGKMADIQKVMQPFGAYAEKAEVNGSAGGYLVNHTARLYLLNKDQELLLSYPFEFDVNDLRNDLALLLESQET